MEMKQKKAGALYLHSSFQRARAVKADADSLALSRARARSLSLALPGWRDRAMNRLKSGLARHGLNPADLPAALLIHELLGAAMATAFWAACYATQPSTTALEPLARRVAAAHPAAQRLWQTSVAAAQARVRKTPWLSRTGADPARLALSLAESLMLRACIKPGTFVFKLWASAALVKGGKRVIAGRKAARLACATTKCGVWSAAPAARAMRRIGPWVCGQ